VASGTFELSEGTLTSGQWQFQPARFTTEGFAAALDRLLATCPAAQPTSTPVAARNLGTSVAK
jgi:hypothetical protein